MSSPANTLVLVTGGSGFLGSYCIIELLKAGYQVRTTLRSVTRSSILKDALKSTKMVTDESLQRLSFVAADLVNDQGWDAAVAGCKYVLHVASPFPAEPPKNEQDLIIPAKDGTLRVLRAAKSANVARVVLTSSVVAVSSGHPDQSSPFTEESWTNLDSSAVQPYAKSKTLAEQAAWQFIESSEGKGLELSVVNPVGIFGPVLNTNLSTSTLLVKSLLTGQLRGCPDVALGIVDVRDVAALHHLAMASPLAAGERFIATTTPCMTVHDIALTLKERLPQHAAKVSTRKVPNLVLRVVGLFNSQVAGIVPQLGKRSEASSEKAKSVLGWQPRSREDAVIATAESLVELGILA